MKTIKIIAIAAITMAAITATIGCGYDTVTDPIFSYPANTDSVPDRMPPPKNSDTPVPADETTQAKTPDVPLPPSGISVEQTADDIKELYYPIAGDAYNTVDLGFAIMEIALFDGGYIEIYLYPDGVLMDWRYYIEYNIGNRDDDAYISKKADMLEEYILQTTGSGLNAAEKKIIANEISLITSTQQDPVYIGIGDRLYSIIYSADGFIGIK